MSRLTKIDYLNWININGYYTVEEANRLTLIEYKLGKLEDIMEKYDIESIEELETKVKCVNEDIEKANQKLSELYLKDRDTWKRACELACIELGNEIENTLCKYYIMSPEDVIYYFYTQAQKEMKDG